MRVKRRSGRGGGGGGGGRRGGAGADTDVGGKVFESIEGDRVSVPVLYEDGGVLRVICFGDCEDVTARGKAGGRCPGEGVSTYVGG